jgi:hypothetical protein
VEVWKVDIVSMSLGSKFRVPIIDNVLTQHADTTLFFVAASNCGGKEVGVSWPACQDQVICVFATDGEVNPYDKNPSRRADKDNLAFLGQSVKGCWPEALNASSRYPVKSGTSCATPIAASVAACILTFMRLQMPFHLAGLPEAERPEHATNCAFLLRKLKKPHIMKKLLKTLGSSDREGYDCVAPWEIFKGEGDDTSLQAIFDCIRKLVDN